MSLKPQPEPAAGRSIVRAEKRVAESAMSVDPDHLRQSGRTLSDSGTLIEKAAHAARPSTSMLGRLAAAVSVAQVGARLVPVAGRLLRRYPVGSLLVVVGLLGALYLVSDPQTSSRAPPGRPG